MKISHKLIQEYIKCSLSPQELGEKLTMAGLEVSAIERTMPELRRCLVGQIIEIASHPQADRLTVCQVKVGEEILTIVCGAKNMKVNDKVPVALVGCKLPGGIHIKKSKIRGVVSKGMMCSEKELGLSEDASGLMILPADAPLGEPISSYLGEVVLDLDLTPNRGDCFSIRGIVREIAALTGETPRNIEIDFSEEGENIQDLISIKVAAPDLCLRYAARVISGVTIGPSPAWLVWRVKSLGLRSINNVVDVTNFVLMEWGQPLHAFDYDLIQGRQIIVRRAKEGEKIVTLDGVDRQLAPDELVIADAERPIALAGVMGGANTEVSGQSQDILLESAFFDPVRIRRTSNLLGLHSEASHRFERGVDPDSVMAALNRATQLVLEVAGGKVAKGAIDIYPEPFQSKTIPLRLFMIKKVLGVEVPRERVLRILQDLDFSILQIDESKLQVHVPSFRWDIEREIDLIEEIARIYGYSNIPISFPAAAVCLGDKKDNLEAKVKNIFVGLGFCEAINFSFISGRILDDLPAIDPSQGGRIYLKNPLVEDYNTMRTSLLPGLLRNVAYNQNRQMDNIRLFEVGKCFFPGHDGSLPGEKMMLAALMQGTRDPASWRGKAELLSFFDLKGVVAALMSALGVCDYSISPKDTPWLMSPQAACLRVADQPIGYLGKVGQSILEYFDIEREVFAVEMQLDLLKLAKKAAFKPIPKYPSVSRDLALIVPEQISYRAIEQSVREMNIEILQEIRLFDLYRGKQIPSGKKSLGLSLIYQSLSKTLTDREVNRIHKKVIDYLTQKFSASLRG